jgi:hypothetical protein
MANKIDKILKDLNDRLNLVEKENKVMKYKVAEIPELKLKVLKLTGKVNAMNARMFARGKSDRLSNPGATRIAGYTDYKKKVSNWHNMFHGKHVTDGQIQQMKAGVGKTFDKRKQIPRSPGINNYGSMKTDSLKAAQYALGRTPNRTSSHGGSSTKSRTPTSSQKSVTSRRR